MNIQGLFENRKCETLTDLEGLLQEYLEACNKVYQTNKEIILKHAENGKDMELVELERVELIDAYGTIEGIQCVISLLNKLMEKH